MKNLFDRTTINGMELRNRFVRSATWEGMCDEHGRPGPKLADCYRNLARGGVGLIITGYTFVRLDGKQTRGSLGAHRDDLASAASGTVRRGPRRGRKALHAARSYRGPGAGGNGNAVARAVGARGSVLRRDGLGNDATGHRRGDGGIRRKRGPGTGVGFRLRSDPCGPRLPDQSVSLPQHECQDGCLRRQRREPRAASLWSPTTAYARRWGPGFP